VTTDGTITGLWDPARIDQVLTNLLSNALKYGGGSTVRVAVERRGDDARISVRDGGIGIPAEQHQRIFERFERGVEARSYGGFGLGLWIASQIVRASGGGIELVSAPSQGACFTVRLPIRQRTSSESTKIARALVSPPGGVEG